MRLSWAAVCAGSVMLASCALPHAPLLSKVAEVHADGTRTALADERLSPFIRLMRTRLAAAGKQPGDTTIVALEKDLPEGAGDEGFYAAVIRHGGTGELRYFEQSQHMPRVDRFYQRALTGAEVRAVDEILKQTPVAAMPKAVLQMMAPATEPASVPGSAPATESAAPLEVAYRVTSADAKKGETVEVRGFAGGSPTGLVGEVSRLCLGGGFTCVYVQPIPGTAKVLFADPHRKVVGIWTEGDALRAMIRDEIPAETSKNPEWYAFLGGKWEKTDQLLPPGTAPAPFASAATPVPQRSDTTPLPASTAPTPAPPRSPRPMRVETYTSGNRAIVPANIQNADKNPTTSAARPAIPPTTARADSVVVAAAASRFSNPGMLPEVESWWTEPEGSYTTVWHYMPVSETNGQRFGFVVPTFVFDDEHAAINVSQRMLYILHDGHLISLPIPAAAFGKQGAVN